jgi:hypothetical protein
MNNEHTRQGGLDGGVSEWRGGGSRWRSRSGVATAAGVEGEEWVLESLHDQQGIRKVPLHEIGDGE